MENRILTCIGCPLGCTLTAVPNGEGYDISGYTCKRGLEYAQKGPKPPCDTIPLIPTGGVRYTVPVAIRKDAAEGEVTIRLRVDNVYRNKYLCLYKDGERLVHRKRMIMAPGEMETIKIELSKLTGAEKITLRLED